MERGLVSISNNMAEERPPTNEEIVDLRARTSAFVSENEEGSNYLLVFKNLNEKRKVTKNKSYLSHFADVEPNDYKRLMSDDEYLSRFFLHCTDIPGDNLKNTEEMIIRSLRFRKENGVRGNFSRV